MLQALSKSREAYLKKSKMAKVQEFVEDELDQESLLQKPFKLKKHVVLDESEGLD
jgi:hypothetical protein